MWYQTSLSKTISVTFPHKLQCIRHLYPETLWSQTSLTRTSILNIQCGYSSSCSSSCYWPHFFSWNKKIILPYQASVRHLSPKIIQYQIFLSRDNTISPTQYLHNTTHYSQKDFSRICILLDTSFSSNQTSLARNYRQLDTVQPLIRHLCPEILHYEASLSRKNKCAWKILVQMWAEPLSRRCQTFHL